MALPGSGDLSIKDAAGWSRSIAVEVDGNIVGNKSLATLSVSAGKTPPHGMREFLGYASGFPPNPPTNASATQLGQSIRVSWSAPTGVWLAEGYRIYRSVNNGSYTILDSFHTSLTFTDTQNLVAGYSYRYRIYATNSFGDSAGYAESNSVTYQNI